jgi:hypothetical protein
MTTTNAEPSAAGSKSGRRCSKFTPQVLEKIKEMVAQGLSREEIAKSLDATVGTLQVTCSRFGISLRRPPVYYRSYERLKPQLQPPLVEKDSRPKGKLTITIKQGDALHAVDVPLPDNAIAELGLLASVRGVGFAELIAEILAGAVKKGVVGKIVDGHDIRSRA